MSDAKDIVADIFDGAASTANTIANALPGEAGAIVKVGASIAAMVGGFIRGLGVNETAKLIEELQRRVDEGKITPELLAMDDAAIKAAVSKFYTDD